MTSTAAKVPYVRLGQSGLKVSVPIVRLIDSSPIVEMPTWFAFHVAWMHELWNVTMAGGCYTSWW
jgi:hypothetical protein